MVRGNPFKDMDNKSLLKLRIVEDDKWIKEHIGPVTEKIFSNLMFGDPDYIMPANIYKLIKDMVSRPIKIIRRNTVTDEKRIEAIRDEVVKLKKGKIKKLVTPLTLAADMEFLLEYIEDMKLVELQQKDQENKEAMDKLVCFTEGEAEDMANKARGIAYPKVLFDEDRELFLINVINQMKAEGLRLLYKLTGIDK